MVDLFVGKSVWIRPRMGFGWWGGTINATGMVQDWKGQVREAIRGR
jgi:hypothetical protein